MSVGVGLKAARAALLALAFATPALAGCIGQVRDYYAFEPDERYVNPGVFPGQYVTPGAQGSEPLIKGVLPFSPSAEVFRIRSDVDAELIPMAVWRPYDGLVKGGVPIIVDAGPYFERKSYDWGTGSHIPHTIDEPQQRGQGYLASFVPHGYAYAQVAVRGTGTHGGCMELMSNTEAADISQAVTFLAEQPWSNSNVAMIGASYDGSTPWMVAAQGNPHLKAIVPVSGLPDIFDLMFHNGTSEARGPFMHDVAYWPFGFNRVEAVDDVQYALEQYGIAEPIYREGVGVANGERTPDQEAKNAVCPEMVKGSVMGPFAAVMGIRDPEVAGYWTERNYRDRVLANYKGSVFLVHGLQDWNVDPHAAIPFNQALKDAGIEVKEWYGQWGHAYPDSACPKEVPEWMWTPCRADWHEVLLRYFDAKLKGLDRDHGAATQVQDDHGRWRIAESWPPRDADWIQLHAGSDGRLSEEPGAAGSSIILPPGQGITNFLEFRTEPFAEDTHVAGLPQFHVSFEAQGPGGFLGAWVFNESPEGKVHGKCVFFPQTNQPVCESLPPMAWGQIDLRFHAGGSELQPLVPGQTYTARLEFEPIESFVPAGHRLSVWLFQYAYADNMNGPVPSPVKVLMGGDSPTVLRVPALDVDPLTIFPVPGSHPPAKEAREKYLVAKPMFDQVVPPINDARAAHARCLDQLRTQFLVALVPSSVAPVERCAYDVPAGLVVL